jgi:type I restriction enzyme S subunit
MKYWKHILSLDDLINGNNVELGRGRIISSIDLETFPGINPVYSSSSKQNGLFGKYDRFDFEEELITWSVDGGGYFFYRPKHKFSITNVSGFLRILNGNKLDYKFIYYLFSYQHSKLKFDYVDKAHPSVIRKQYWIPEIDKLEQTRIAHILSKADVAIAQTEALIAKYHRIKTGLIQDLLTRGIDKYGNIRSKATHRFVVKNGIEVPEEWEVLRLKDCVTPGTTITYGIVQTGLHRPDGVQVLRTVDLKEDYIDSSNLLRTSPEISNLFKRTILVEGDLVCNVRASVGDFNIIPKELEGVNTTRGVARISPRKEINNRYLLWFLKSETNKRQMELLIKGTTFIDINIADLREIFVCIPKDKVEQDKIADNLESILNKINKARLTLNKLQSLRVGLMQDLLSGKVRVKKEGDTLVNQ